MASALDEFGITTAKLEGASSLVPVLDEAKLEIEEFVTEAA